MISKTNSIILALTAATLAVNAQQVFLHGETLKEGIMIDEKSKMPVNNLLQFKC